MPLEIPEPALLPALVAALEVPAFVEGIAAVGTVGVASYGEFADLGALNLARLPSRDVGRVTSVLEHDAPEAIRPEVMRQEFYAAVVAAAAVVDDTLDEINHGGSRPPDGANPSRPSIRS